MDRIIITYFSKSSEKEQELAILLAIARGGGKIEDLPQRVKDTPAFKKRNENQWRAEFGKWLGELQSGGRP